MRGQYGRLYQGRNSILAHRLSYEAFVGEIPGDLLVLHSCDNPGCINPNHLRVGTTADNAQDREDRHRRPTRRGEQSNFAKLTEDQVREIRASTASLAELAAKYEVDPANIWNIRAGKTWRHVKAA